MQVQAGIGPVGLEQLAAGILRQDAQFLLRVVPVK